MIDPSKKYFHCTDRERAIFEAGIKLGAIFHQYTGMPINESNKEDIEKTIEKSVKLQPFVNNIRVKISMKGQNGTSFNYNSLSGEMLDVELAVSYNGQEVKARMQYLQALNYPLMYLEE
ncbi:dihydroneopterin aldolase family protein [Ferroplasma sp.]|uniref:dihydroneopterin aldolase family protein n=1 Tax=Ferroplasma sp. TaxID=2591003 RepID=UPI00307D3535